MALFLYHHRTESTLIDNGGVTNDCVSPGYGGQKGNLTKNEERACHLNSDSGALIV